MSRSAFCCKQVEGDGGDGEGIVGSIKRRGSRLQPLLEDWKRGRGIGGRGELSSYRRREV